MATINSIMAVMAVLGGLLCARAFLPHINILGKRPTEYLARGLTLCALSAFPRVFYWDILRPRFDIELGLAYYALNFLLLFGLYCILRARWLTIPENERDRYNIFTAVFYPKNIVPRMRREEE